MPYNHAVSVAFTVVSDDPKGADITSSMLREGLTQRLRDLEASGRPDNPEGEWLEACLPVWDTYEMENEHVE